MKKNENSEDFALFRFSIICPLVNGTTKEKSISAFARRASENIYMFKEKECMVSLSTIKRWYYSYKKDGFDGLIHGNLCKSYLPKKLSEDARIECLRLIEQYPKITSTKIYEKLIESMVISSDEISLRSIQRFVAEFRNSDDFKTQLRKHYEMKHPNDMWQTDTSVGPYILLRRKKYRTYIIMFLDDCTRCIVGFGVFLQDNQINMQKTFKRAIRSYGIPKILYCDNGGPYVARQLKLICAQLGIEHKTAKPYSPEAKGKVERAFRTIKDGWMNSCDWNNFACLEDVEKSLSEFIKKYNSSKHSTTGKIPEISFFEYNGIKEVTNESELAAKFMHRIERKVNNCRCINVNNIKYEVENAKPGSKIEITFDPEYPDKLYYKGRLLKMLDVNKNAGEERYSEIDYSKVINNEDDVIDLNKKAGK